MLGIGEEGITAAIAHFSPADQSAYRFAYKKIAFQGLRETVAPENGLTAAGGEMVKGAVLSEAFLPSLYIGGTDDRSYMIEIAAALIVEIDPSRRRVLLGTEGWWVSAWP